MWLMLLSYLAVQAVMLPELELDLEANVLLTAFMALLGGFFLMTGLICSLEENCLLMKTKLIKETPLAQQQVCALTLTFAGILTAVMLAVLDIMYYSNRNIKYWTYINNSAFPAGFFLISVSMVTGLDAKIN